MSYPLVVTLMHRQVGIAWHSWATAFRHWQESHPHQRFDHIKLYGDDGQHTDGTDILVQKYKDAWSIFLAGPWDIMICLEDDMIIPADTFPRLLAMLEQGADIAYGLYCFRHGTPRLSAHFEIGEQSHRGLSTNPEFVRANWGRTVQVAGVGLGCTALKRSVIECIPVARRGTASNDWYLSLDAAALGLVQVCDLGLVCGHFSQTPSPRIIYPTLETESLYRVEYL